MLKFGKITLNFLIVVILTSSCATQDFTNLTTALKQANKVGFTQEIHQTDTFKLTSFSRLNKLNAPLIVYVEGDGHSIKSRTRLSDNPTPHQPLALQLATLDSRQNVIYIARPCQYTPITRDAWCDKKYWSTHRFAPEVIHAINQVIDNVTQKLSTKEVHLIGFSGGASIVTLVAANREDIKTIITVAGDLNHREMTKYHQTTPLKASLCPVDIANHIAHIPQRHYVGKKDKIVPIQIAKSFKSASKNSDCVIIQSLDNTHHQGWATVWPKLIHQPINCL